MGMERKGQTAAYILVAIALVIVVFMAYIFLSGTINNGITGKTVSDGVSNSIQNIVSKKICREEQVPYENQEEYQGLEDVEIDLKYRINQAYGRESYSELLNVRYKGIVEVQNIDSETGYFQVQMGFETLDDGIFTEKTGGSIMPGEIIEFNIYHDIDSGEDVDFTYKVIPGTKMVTKPVTKYRTVTRYRTEEVCE